VGARQEAIRVKSPLYEKGAVQGGLYVLWRLCKAVQDLAREAIDLNCFLQGAWSA